MAGLIVTTAVAPSLEMESRARAVAARCGGSYVCRARGIRALMRAHAADVAYVVRRERDEVRDENEHLYVHRGLLATKLSIGARHPFVRALWPEGAPPVRSVVDATLGLCGDALHVAASLGARVLGIEASPTLYSLAEEGLGRMSRGRDPLSRVAGRVVPCLGRAQEVLASLPAASHDVVFLDPMFRAPRRAAGGYDLLRKLAVSDPPSAALLDAAMRVARHRIVLKVGKGEHVDYPWTARVPGKALDYLVAAAKGPKKY